MRTCRRGLELIIVDCSRSIAEQGPFDLILHKLTDTMIRAMQGDEECQHQLKLFKVGSIFLDAWLL